MIRVDLAGNVESVIHEVDSAGHRYVSIQLGRDVGDLHAGEEGHFISRIEIDLVVV